MNCSKTTLGSSRATPTTSSMPCSRKCSGGIRTTASGVKRAAQPNPAQTKPNLPKRERGPNATSTRIARLPLGHPRDGHWSLPVLRASVPRGADLFACHCHARSASLLELQIPLLHALVHHTLLGVFDASLWSLHLHAQGPRAHLARSPPEVSRSQ